MDDKYEEVNRLKQASLEIKSLRNQNQLMSARLQVFDQLMALFHTAPAYLNQGFSPDIAYDLDRLVKEKEDEISKSQIIESD